jgi:AcrR family transcriptional regulator
MPTATDPDPLPLPVPRDRAATATRILAAAQDILTQSGPAGFGVNAVARAARVDKQLIYRYFGGLDGLLDALGEQVGKWWNDRLGQDLPDPAPATYALLVEHLALHVLRILRSEPLARQSVVWELSGHRDVIAPFARARSRALAVWITRAHGDLTPPPGADAAAINALVIAAVGYMAVAAAASDQVIGLDVADDAAWMRIEAALVDLIRRAYAR